MTDQKQRSRWPNEEEIRETTWNLCKQYDLQNRRRHDKVLLSNFVSAELEKLFNEEIENDFRTEWLEEVQLFCEKYGYNDNRRGRPPLSTEEKTVVVSVTLTESDADWLADLGNGNVSKGARMAIQASRMFHNITKTDFD